LSYKEFRFVIYPVTIISQDRKCRMTLLVAALTLPYDWIWNLFFGIVAEGLVSR
jgi:hypothetical protein